MANEIKVSLIKDGSQTDNVERTIEEPVSELAMPLVGRVTRLASAGVLAKIAYDLAKKSYERINEIERDGRVINDSLRNYGGSGWSANTIGDRFNVFGRKIDGESVAYKK